VSTLVAYSIANDVDDDYHDYENTSILTTSHNDLGHELENPLLSLKYSASLTLSRGFIGQHLTGDLMSGKKLT
jgi:hypothetical protein